MTGGDAQNSEVKAAADAVARRSYGKLVAFLSARTRDIAAAEDALAEAFASALSHWPTRGIPDNPEAWLMAAAKRKAIDAFRRNKMLARKHAMLAHDPGREQDTMPDLDA